MAGQGPDFWRSQLSHLSELGSGAWTTNATQRLSQLGQQVGQAINETAMRPCVSCGEQYIRAGMMTCVECHQPCCRNCLKVTSFQGPAAPSSQKILCKGCVPVVKKRCTQGNVEQRLTRTEAFLLGQMEAFTYDPESKMEQTLRLSGHVMQGLKKFSSFIPFSQAAQAIEAGYYLVRYGPLILAGNEIMESFQLILGLAKKLELPAYHRLASPDFFGGLYYSMGEHWGHRGRVPELEAAQHAINGEVPSPDHGLLLMLRHLTRLLLVSKESTPTDAQRLLRQAMPGAELVLAELSGSPTIPSFFLVCSREAKVAYLVMPGTRNLSDLVTDFNATEEAFGEGHGHRGMVEAARWMEEQVGPALIKLYTSGYRVTILGHSLGAGVGAFLTLILRPHISNLCCYGFGTPACIDENLMPGLLNCMVSVVNRDDLVPRLSVKSVQGLLESVLCPGQVAKTQAWMKEDWQAVKDFERVIELRRRGQKEAEGALGTDGSPAPGDAYGTDGAATGEDESLKLMMLMEAGVDRTRALRALRAENGDLNAAMLRATAEEVASDATVAPEAPPSAPPPPEAPPPASSWMPSMPSSRLGGLWQEVSHQAQHITQMGASKLQGIHLGPRPPADPAPPDEPGEEISTAVELPRPPHLQLLIPGQVIHLYRMNGIARAAPCSAFHETLTRIIPSQEMLKDHQMESYARALHQACLKEPPLPSWESFDARELCACCNSDFTWAYVLQSEPQKMLSRHHCFSCGRVVCEGCSRKRLSHERLGFQMPVRTCDSCAFAQFEDAADAMAAFAEEEAAAKAAAASR